MNGTKELHEIMTYVSVYESVPFVHVHVTSLDAHFSVESTIIGSSMMKGQPWLGTALIYTKT